MDKLITELSPPRRILMGPGPSNCHPRVLKAMATPLIGHLDPEFLEIMNDTQELLRRVFKTENQLTIPISGTGSSGMEATICNLVEEGDDVIVCVNGTFGARMVDIAERNRARVIRVDEKWGRAIPPEKVAEALKSRKVKLVAIVHAETSTGVYQQLEEIGCLAREHGALFLVDAVTSLGGCPVEVDKWGIDACYSATQKCLSAPPGLAPVTFSPRALEMIENRKTRVPSWYLDMTLVKKYWGKERVYHHTAPISMIYALREALRIILEEGLKARFARHELNHRALAAGLEAMGIDYLPPRGERLWMLNSIMIPAGVDDNKVRSQLLDNYSMEIGGGLGEFKGKVWRVGLMGESSTQANIILFLSALEEILNGEGYPVEVGAAIQAASDIYNSE